MLQRCYPVLLLLAAASLAGAGCSSRFDHPAPPDAGTMEQDPGPRFPGAGLGQACSDDQRCRLGLTCQGSSCELIGSSPMGQRCLLHGECASGLTCGWAGLCATAGQGDVGAACSSASDCKQELFCASSGLAGFCTAPTAPGKDLDQPCAETAECLAGLVCSPVSQTCVPGSLLLNPDLYEGVACPDLEEAKMPFGVRMVVPRPGRSADFYALPFPNDVRRPGGKLALADHPRPGPGLLGFDVVGAVLDALTAEAKGFAAEPAVYFRFTRAVDPATLLATGDTPTLRFVDLDGGADPSFFFSFVAKRNKYICSDYLMVHPSWARPLSAGHTYAVLVGTGVKDAADAAGVGGGEAAQPLDDLALLLSTTAPATAEERTAWDSYAKLRAWLAAGGQGFGPPAGAAVFTVGDPMAEMRQVRDAAALATPPTVAGGWTVCGGGAKSPCATPGWAETADGQAGLPDPRDCPAAVPAGFRELHAKLHVPMLQEGGLAARPYRASGGALARDPVGHVATAGYEDVCMALVLPDSAMPADGWPLLLYSHGTGGSFRSAAAELALVNGLAGRLNAGILSMDQPMHGPRANAPGADPAPLFFNFANPPATKGNVLQGAADGLALLRFAANFHSAIPGVGDVRFDPDKLLFTGHSQGALTGVLFLPFAGKLRAAMLSGLGGALVYSLLGKKQPYDASVGLRAGLQEVEIDATHPVLHLVQAYFEPTDALYAAPLLYLHPEGTPVNVLHVLGWDDSFAPWQGQSIFAAATGGTFAAQAGRPPTIPSDGLDPVTDLGMAHADLPIAGNVQAGGTAITGATLAYLSDGTYDGHFVAYHDPCALQQEFSFFLAALTLAAPAAPAVPQCP